MRPESIMNLYGAAAAMAALDDEVSRYFQRLGFQVSWDTNWSRDRHWYEIYDGDKLLLQIDFGAPLAEIVSDLPRLASGEPGAVDSTWEVRGPMESLRRVADRMVLKP